MTTADRRLRRFFSSIPLTKPGQNLRLTPEESRHLRNILRFKPGDRCLVTDGEGREAVAEIQSFPPDGTAELVLTGFSDSHHDTQAVQLRIFQAIPKGLKLEFLIQKAQELGVTAFFPLETERTVVRVPEKKQSSKLERWHKIAAQAAKQSGSLRLLEIYPPCSLEKGFEHLREGSEVALLHPGLGSVPFRDWFKAVDERRFGDSSIILNLFLGPEGGFSRKEVERVSEEAVKQRWQYSKVDLGSRILRADTAFLGVAAALHLLLDSTSS